MTKNVKQKIKTGGFTLIELLIVIGILGILAAIVLVAVDPAKRLRQARDARRTAEVNAILNAILNYTVDNKGTLPSAITTSTTAVQIGTGSSGCGGLTYGVTTCDALEHIGVFTPAACANLDATLVDTYIAEIPVDPKGSDTTSTALTGARTGYYLRKTANGRIEIGSCYPEDTTSIKVKR